MLTDLGFISELWNKVSVTILRIMVVKVAQKLTILLLVFNFRLDVFEEKSSVPDISWKNRPVYALILQLLLCM